MAEQVDPALKESSESLNDLDSQIAKLFPFYKQEFRLKDDIVALHRFLFLGIIQPIYGCHGPHNYSLRFSREDELGIMSNLKNLATLNPAAIVTMCKKALESKSLPTKENLLFVIAYALCSFDEPELKKEIRMSLNQLIETPEDFLQFLSNYKKWGSKKLTFGRGMREAVKKFYDNKSPSELLEIVFATSNVDKIRHVDVLHLTHSQMENEDKNEIIKASRMSYDKIKAAAETSTTMKKILKYKDLKRCRESHEIVSILKRKDFVYKLDHLPTNALKSAEVVELILPNMSLTELLGNLEKLCTNQMLRNQSPVARKICNALQCSNKVISEAKLNPLYVFQILRTLEKKMLLETTDDAADKTKEKEKKFSNPFIIKKLQHIFNQTINDQPKTGCRYYVTVDFRKFSKRQSKVPGMKDVLCSEVQAIVALTLLKNEKNVTVMTFTDDRCQLKPVAWTADMTFEKAMEIYESEIKTTPKIKEHVVLPMRKATVDKKKVDVFITFVSSIGRTMGKNCKPPLEQLKEYRTAMNMKMTKFVVVNLARFLPDFRYTKEQVDETGILELVGFNADSMKIVEAYAKNCFN